MTEEPGSIQSKVNDILLRFRITPLLCKKSPGEMYLNCQLRTTLDLLYPKPVQVKEAINPPISKKLSVGDRVQARVYQSSSLWKYGTIAKVLGRLHYNILLDEGYIIKRHQPVTEK